MQILSESHLNIINWIHLALRVDFLEEFEAQQKYVLVVKLS